MVSWLLLNVSKRNKSKKLTFGEIADFTGSRRSSVQRSISNFDNKLKSNLNGLFLGRLLRTADSLGFGLDRTYRILAKKEIVPYRKRRFDGFDDLDQLI